MEHFMGVFRRGENGPAPMPPVMRRPNPPPQSAAEIKAKVTSMCAGVEKTGEAVISDVNRLVSEAKRGELVLVRLIDAYEERTQRARQVMSDLMSKGLCELEDALRKANDEAMNHLESRVSSDTEAPKFDPGEIVDPFESRP